MKCHDMHSVQDEKERKKEGKIEGSTNYYKTERSNTCEHKHLKIIRHTITPTPNSITAQSNHIDQEDAGVELTDAAA